MRGQVDAAHVAVHADHRRQARGQVQVGGLVLDDEGEQFGDVHYNFPESVEEVRESRRGSKRQDLDFSSDTSLNQPQEIMATIAANLQAVREPHRARGASRRKTRSDDIALVAVSKTFPAGAWSRRRMPAGQRAFGENQAQEGRGKNHGARPHLAILEWHFIGPIQSNKTRAIAEHFQWVHGVEREKIAERLNEARPAGLPPLNVCIQVNVSGEASKSGVAPGRRGGARGGDLPAAAAAAARPDGDPGADGRRGAAAAAASRCCAS